jgi:hypothetical protein
VEVQQIAATIIQRAVVVREAFAQAPDCQLPLGRITPLPLAQAAQAGHQQIQRVLAVPIPYLALSLPQAVAVAKQALSA